MLGASAALLLAGVLGSAGAAKVRDRRNLEATLAAMAPSAPVRTLAGAVIAAELGVAALLLSGAAPRAGAIAALALLLAFTGALGLLQRRGSADCGCFGAAEEAPSLAVGFVRNALLCAAAAVAIGGTSPWAAGPARAALAATVALGLACIWLLAQALRRLSADIRSASPTTAPGAA